MIPDAGWSDKFSLDTVNFSGSIQCKLRSRIYELSYYVIYPLASKYVSICHFVLHMIYSCLLIKQAILMVLEYG